VLSGRSHILRFCNKFENIVPITSFEKSVKCKTMSRRRAKGEGGGGQKHGLVQCKIVFQKHDRQRNFYSHSPNLLAALQQAVGRSTCTIRPFSTPSSPDQQPVITSMYF
jgi:hypothetical protein